MEFRKNAIQRHSRVIPAVRGRPPVRYPQDAYKPRAVPRKQSPVRTSFTSRDLRRTGRRNISVPAIKPVLHRMEPRAFPRAMSGNPFTDAIVENSVSGRVVPRLTIVAPISTSGSLNRFASDTALSTKSPLPHTRSTSPSENINI